MALEELQARTEGSDELLKLLQNPLSTNFQQESIWASFGTSIGFTVLIAIAFSFLRPYNSVVYAPKLKHADEAHSPPPLGKGIFAWIVPVLKTNEQDLVRFMGLDATVFLRFTRMCRNIFLTISLLGCCILIPINLAKGAPSENESVITRLTPVKTWGQANWGQVVCAYMFTAVVAGFLWYNYRKVLQLRRQYYDSPEYLNSLHSRTLMINDIPNSYQSDEGIGRLIDEVVPTSSFSRTAIGRNVKDLPELIAEHESTVKSLEKHLAKYLKNPDSLPPSRPTCKPSKKDPSFGSYPKGHKVDAIDYLTDRIRALEMQIKDIRLGVDKRDAMSYGFASYEDIAEAHSIAYACRKKHPHGTTIVLAPRPNDVIWKNMPLTPKMRRWKRFVNNLWVAVLTILWIAPNAMISIFLVNLANLGRVWPAFQRTLSANTSWWAIVQGVASPALTSLIFLLLPILFRRMSIRAGDRTKTSRERHVTGKLYTFFVFNNLIIFSIFSTLWNFATSVIQKTGQGRDVWQAIQDANLASALFISICSISPFWVTWLLQRNLGSAVDLAQLWTLLWSSCMRKFSSPTPRELIELTAPQAFDYASYYNYFLFYSTVTLAYATIQPLVLPAAALYFAIDVYLKKYLLLYIFVTKTESGGMFWRILFNRLVFATMLANLVVFIAVWERGGGYHVQAYSIIPIPFLMIIFKIYCRRAFDHKVHYAVTANLRPDNSLPAPKSRKSDRLASRYGHPALYKPLITPMVHANAQHRLAAIYRGRLSDPNNADDHNDDFASISGYSDTYALDAMNKGKAGAAAARAPGMPGFEVVPESKLDFSYYKDRAEFGDDHGAGDIYQRALDPYERPGTADTFRSGYRGGTPGSSRAGSPAPPVPMVPGAYGGGGGAGGTSYAAGYAQPMGGQWEAEGDVGMNGGYGRRDRSLSQTREGLVRNAQGVPVSAPYGKEGDVPPGFLGGGPRGYGGLPQSEAVESEEEIRRRMRDPLDYDYFRSSARRHNSGWQGWTG